MALASSRERVSAISCDVSDIAGELGDEVQMSNLAWGMSVWLGLETVGEWLVVCQHMEFASF